MQLRYHEPNKFTLFNWSCGYYDYAERMYRQHRQDEQHSIGKHYPELDSFNVKLDEPRWKEAYGVSRERCAVRTLSFKQKFEAKNDSTTVVKNPETGDSYAVGALRDLIQKYCTTPDYVANLVENFKRDLKYVYHCLQG